MKISSKKTSSYREKKKIRKNESCHLCRNKEEFNWQCRCGFTICQDCMYENFWGMSCNGITWDCPDCGAQNGLGNQ